MNIELTEKQVNKIIDYLGLAINYDDYRMDNVINNDDYSKEKKENLKNYYENELKEIDNFRDIFIATLK